MKQVFLFLAIVLFTDLYAQNDAKAFDDLVKKDSFTLALLFSYPDSIYNSILVASAYPKGFSRLSEIQKKSSDSFKMLISSFNRNRQKQLWEITRFPELIAVLIQNKDKPKNELLEQLNKYPDKISNSAIHFVKNEYPTLLEMDKIHQDFKKDYTDLQKDFPDEVKNAYNTLLGNPELITILSENITTTTSIGDLYKRDPSLIKEKADSLNFEIVKEQGIEFESWKAGINKDETVQKELRELAKEYANDDTYNDDVYARSDEPREVDTSYQVAPYPYWAGYPYWYGRNYWYPYPWWSQMGFYWPLVGPMQYYGLPSYHFGWWYYNQPNRYYRRYPNTRNYFYRHYQGQRQRNFGSDFNRSTQEFYRGRRR